MADRILLVEDDYALALGTEYALQAEGYEVVTAGRIEQAYEMQREGRPDLILLDVMLPDGNGYDFCRKIRQEGCQTPIIFLTAVGEEVNIVQGLECGADDYVTKPFGMMELVSRIKAVLRRSRMTEEKSQIELSGICMNIKKHEVTVNGKEVALTLKEFELLEKMMLNKGIVLTRDQLLTEIWGYDFDGETRTVDVHVRTLRQKLGEKGDLIQTVRGVGYRVGGE